MLRDPEGGTGDGPGLRDHRAPRPGAASRAPSSFAVAAQAWAHGRALRRTDGGDRRGPVHHPAGPDVLDVGERLAAARRIESERAEELPRALRPVAGRRDLVHD